MLYFRSYCCRNFIIIEMLILNIELVSNAYTNAALLILAFFAVMVHEVCKLTDSELLSQVLMSQNLP